MTLDLVTMLAHKAKKIPDEVWQTHKKAIEHLWSEENRKLVGQESVKEIMELRYNFSAS